MISACINAMPLRNSTEIDRAVHTVTNMARESRMPLPPEQLSRLKDHILLLKNVCTERKKVTTDRRDRHLFKAMKIRLTHAEASLATRSAGCLAPLGKPVGDLQLAAARVINERLLQNQQKIPDSLTGVLPPRVLRTLSVARYMDEMRTLMNSRSEEVQNAMPSTIGALKKGLQIHHGLADNEALSDEEQKQLTVLLMVNSRSNGGASEADILFRAGADIRGDCETAREILIAFHVEAAREKLREAASRGPDTQGYLG